MDAAATVDREIALTLRNDTTDPKDTTEASDYSSTLYVYYMDGADEIELGVSGGKITLPQDVGEFFVEVTSTQDDVYEGSENLTLTATVTGGGSDHDISSIVDDATGT